jgi:5-methyltetrahydrofolate--homocysteine methyltransferase
MGIDFDAGRWNRIRRTYREWWDGRLERPLIPLIVGGRDPGRPEPDVPRGRRTANYPFSIAPEQIVDRWDWDLSTRYYVGDAFPQVWIDFGPGVLAAFIGGQGHVDDHTVWFTPRDDRPIGDIRFVYDPNHPWLLRIKAICRAAVERWGGLVQVGMTDLGGNLDILSTFRPSEKLLLDLYDHPDEVDRLTWEAHELWHRCFADINAILRPANPGYTAWAGIFSDRPHYMLQCDFCYMISPDMFDRFVKPELAATCRRLADPFYHLDGVGQLPHLDSLLAIPELKGIQWVPGDGKPPCANWPDVYRRIRSAGKLVQFLGNLDGLETMWRELGSVRGFVTGFQYY